jgi:hypothetical protein
MWMEGLLRRDHGWQIQRIVQQNLNTDFRGARIAHKAEQLGLSDTLAVGG